MHAVKRLMKTLFNYSEPTELQSAKSVKSDELDDSNQDVGFEEPFLYCQICAEQFNMFDRTPKMLPCDHTFCLSCVTKPSNGGQRSMCCPICSQQCRITQKLPSDCKVIGLLDQVSTGWRNVRQICFKHPGEQIVFVCETCLIPVCRQCRIVDHRESNGHFITKITHVFKKESSLMHAMKIKSQYILQQLNSKAGHLKKSMESLEISWSQHVLEIKEKSPKFYGKLILCEQTLVFRECQRFRKGRDILQAQHGTTCELTRWFEKNYRLFISQNKDPTKRLNLARKICAQEKCLLEMANHDVVSIKKIVAENDNAYRTDMQKAEQIWSMADQGLEITDTHVHSVFAEPDICSAIPESISEQK